LLGTASFPVVSQPNRCTSRRSVGDHRGPGSDAHARTGDVPGCQARTAHKLLQHFRVSSSAWLTASPHPVNPGPTRPRRLRPMSPSRCACANTTSGHSAIRSRTMVLRRTLDQTILKVASHSSRGHISFLYRPLESSSWTYSLVLPQAIARQVGAARASKRSGP
jgi:hypothetical protein